MKDKIDIKHYRDLIGVPFKFLGRDKEGIDCLGLVYEMYNRLNLKLPYTESIIDRKLRSTSLEQHRNLFKELDNPEAGCVIAIRVAGIVCHIGIMLDSIRFIHAERGKRVCIEKISDLKYKTRIEGYFIFKENINE